MWNVVVREHDTEDFTPDWRRESDQVGCKGFNSGAIRDLNSITLSNGKSANDILSAIAVAPGHVARLCENADGGGRCIDFTGTTDSFTAWNFHDIASSLSIDGASFGGGGGGGGNTPACNAASGWSVGSTVGLKRGAEIWTAPGGGTLTVRIPDNAEQPWNVVVKDGPRCIGTDDWYDIDRKAAGDPSGGTGWVKRSQAQYGSSSSPSPAPTLPGGVSTDCNSGDGLLLYETSGQSGRCLRVYPGTSLSDVGDPLTNSHSYRIRGDGQKALLCAEPNFGRCVRVPDDFGGVDIGNLDNDPAGGPRVGGNIRSLRVEARPTEGPPASCDGNEGVYLYADRNFGGACTRFTADSPNPRSWPTGNDSAHSIRFIGRWVATLCENDNYEGTCWTTDREEPNLDNNPIGGDRASSIRVRRDNGNANPGACDGGDGVYLYQAENYQGRCSKFYEDSANPRMWQIGNDAARSVRLVGSWTATLCENDDYQGRCSTFTADDPDLGNDLIGGGTSSIKATWEGGRGSDPAACDGGGEGVYLYSEPNFEGRCSKFIASSRDPLIWQVGNDEASSIKIVGRWVATVYEHTAYRGTSSTFTASKASLIDEAVGDGRASSIQVTRLPDPVRAELSGLVPGGTLPGATVTFTWSSGVGATEYRLDVGLTVGGEDVATVNTGLSQSATVTGIPTDGRVIHVRLASRFGEGWAYTDYKFNAAATDPTPAAILAPSPTSTLAGSIATFEWNAGIKAKDYWLEVATLPGGYYNVFGQSTGTNQSATVRGLPVDGRPVYVRLWTRFEDRHWAYVDYTFTAATGQQKAEITTPTAGATLDGSTVTFEWSPGVDARDYWLEVATLPGGYYNIFGESTGANHSATVSGIPLNGRPIYVRLWTRFNSGDWSSADYTFTAGAPVKAALQTPTPGATLSGNAVTFEWSPGVDAHDYWLEVATLPGGYYNVFGASTGTDRSVTVPHIPGTGRPLYVRLWTHFNDRHWEFADYTMTAPIPAKGELQTPGPATRLPGDSTTFRWSAGMGARDYRIEVGRHAGTHDIADVRSTDSSATINGIPRDGHTVYVRLSTYFEDDTSAFFDYTYTAADPPPPPLVGNIAARASRSPDSGDAAYAFDGNPSTAWVLGHRFALTLTWAEPVQISRVIVWDRPQNSPDNNQINQLIVELSNGKHGRFDMESGGRRCADITFGGGASTSLLITSDDASGSNGLGEIEVWVGPKTGGPTCSRVWTIP